MAILIILPAPKNDSRWSFPQGFGRGEKGDSKVTVAAGQTKNITFNLKLPQDNIKGTVLGSVYVRKVPKETAKSKGVGVRNAFAMTIPVIISEDFNKKLRRNWR